MSVIKHSRISECLPKGTLLKNMSSLAILESYLHLADIITRTHIAMGRKGAYKTTISNTYSEKIHNNVFRSTH